MYTTLRRTTVVFVMFLEYLVSRKSSSSMIKLTVVIMIIGALVAGIADLQFDFIAYAVVMTYNAFTALYLVLINQIATEEKSKSLIAPGPVSPTGQVVVHPRLDKYDFMFYNNLISIPMLICIIIFTGEYSTAQSSPYVRDPGFLALLLSSSMLAFVLNYAIFWNTAANSALTQTVSGQAKDVVVVVLGFIMFDDAKSDAYTVSGVALGFVGSIMYAAIKSSAQERTIAEWATWTTKKIGGMMGGGSKGNTGMAKMTTAMPTRRKRSEDGGTSEGLPLIHHNGESGAVARLPSQMSV